MPRSIAAAFTLLVGTASAAPLPLMDAPAFAEKATDLMIVRCIDPDTSKGAKAARAVTSEVEVLSVVKGGRKPGKATLVTYPHPMEAGKTYMVAEFHTLPKQPEYIERSEQCFTEVPASLDLAGLAGKATAAQAQMVFDARRAQVEALMLMLQREQKVLEATRPKANLPPR